MSYASKIIFLAVIALVIVGSVPVFAAGSLVPCGLSADDPNTPVNEANPCTLCHIYILGHNIINFLMWELAPVFAILSISWGGFKILISGANPGLRQEGIRIIKNTLYGLLIVFGAWIIIDTLLHFFANGTFRVWTDVKCS